MLPGRFPLGLCIASIVTTWLGLAAAALGIKWGAAPAAGDALRLAWVYVQVMLMLMWLVVWPALALLPGRMGRQGLVRVALLWDWAAMGIGTIPALAMAGFVSGITGTMLAAVLVLQLAIALLAMGVLASGLDSACSRMASAGILATLAVVTPVLAFLWGEFFSTAPLGWFAVVPAFAVVRTASGGLWLFSSAYWGVVMGYAAVGAVFIIAGGWEKSN